MVARLLRLRLTLLGAGFRGSFGRGLRHAALLILLFAVAVGAAFAPTLVASTDGQLAILDTVVGGLLLALVLIVPFAESASRLVPRQFAQYPARPGSVAWALLLTTVVTWPFLALLAWLVTLAAARPEWQGLSWQTPLALALAAALAVCSARVASALSALVVGLQFRRVLRALGAVLLVTAIPVAVFAAATSFREADGPAADAADALGWTPFGAPFAGLWYAAQGDAEAASLRFAVAGATIVLLLALWFLLVRVSNERVARPRARSLARTGLGWFEQFSARPSAVIAARTLTYWVRDPRYRVSLVAIPIAPVVMMLAFWVAGADLHSLALVPLPVIMLLLGWSIHNDVAMDSTAIWQHVASGIRGRADRLGRLAPVMLIGLPVLLVGSSLTVAVLGDWRVLPAVVGMNLAVLLVSAGVSSLFSALMPYPTTRPGDSPFVQPQWSGSGSGLAQTLSMLFAIGLSVPPVWFAGQALADVELLPNLWALAFGAGYGVVVLAIGVLLGGLVFTRRGPELIAITQMFD